MKTQFWQYFGRQRPVVRSLRAAIGKTFLLLPTTFIVAVAIGTVNLGLIFYMRDLYGFSSFLIGAFAAVFSISYFLGCFILRPISRRILPRYCLILSSFIMAFMALLIVVTEVSWCAFIFYSIYGFALALFFPPLVGWLSIGIEGKELNRSISRWNLSWSTGSIVSPFLAGFLTERGLRLPLYTGIVLMFLGGVIILAASIILPAIRNDKHKEIKPTLQENAEGDKSTFLRFPSWVATITLYSVLGVISNIFPLYAREAIGLTESVVGLVLLTRAFFTTVTFVILGRMSWWHFNRVQIFVTQAAVLVLVIVMIQAASLISYLALMPFLGILVSISYSNSLFHGVSGSLERGKRMAVHEALLTSGVVFGSVIGGQLYQHFSMKAAFFFCMVLIVIGLFVQLILIRYAKVRGRLLG